jgi:hypothetical protein
VLEFSVGGGEQNQFGSGISVDDRRLLGTFKPPRHLPFDGSYTQGGTYALPSTGKASSFGEGGVLHYIGTNKRTTPFAQSNLKSNGVRAAMSSVGEWGTGSSPDRFLLHAHDGETENGTDIRSNSWMSVDLGKGRKLAPTHYCLRHGFSGGLWLLRWRFEGSNDDTNWTLLQEHTHTRAAYINPPSRSVPSAWPTFKSPTPVPSATFGSSRRGRTPTATTTSGVRASSCMGIITIAISYWEQTIYRFGYCLTLVQ